MFSYAALVDMIFALTECGYCYFEAVVAVADEFELRDDQIDLLERSYMLAICK